MLSRKSWGEIIGGILVFCLGGLWTKVGCVLGFCLGGPVGAVVGAIIGRAYDKEGASGGNVWSEVRQSNDEQDHTAQVAFATGVIVLSAKMARSDGRVTREEIKAFKRVFKIAPSQEDVVSLVFNRARGSADGFEPYAMRLALVFHDSPSVLEEVLSGLFIIGAADAALSPTEIAFLKQVSSIFGFGAEDFARIAARSGVELPPQERPRPSTPGPFDILGVSETATAAEIKAAYHSLIREHHPDKLMARGVPPEYIATATEKMKRINVAYDAVCKIRGMK